jgi:membrane-associated protein
VTALALGPEWLKPDTILTWLGPWALVGLALIIFAECGLLLGFFLPGDSLLFTAGLFVASGAIRTPLWVMCLLLVAAAVLGNATGYWIGRSAGPAVFDKPQSRLFKPHHVAKTQEFFDRYGNRAIVLGRFVPIVRTFVPFVAGAANMSYPSFVFYNFAGAAIWVGVCFGGGMLFGNIPIVKENFTLVTLGIIGVSVMPIFIEWYRARRQPQQPAA